MAASTYAAQKKVPVLIYAAGALVKSALLVLGAAVILLASGFVVFAADTSIAPKPIRGEVIIKRTASAWESQQVQEPCILPNPKDPARLVMFYSGVPVTNRSLCFIGKAWENGR